MLLLMLHASFGIPCQVQLMAQASNSARACRHVRGEQHVRRRRVARGGAQLPRLQPRGLRPEPDAALRQQRVRLHGLPHHGLHVRRRRLPERPRLQPGALHTRRHLCHHLLGPTCFTPLVRVMPHHNLLTPCPFPCAHAGEPEADGCQCLTMTNLGSSTHMLLFICPMRWAQNHICGHDRPPMPSLGHLRCRATHASRPRPAWTTAAAARSAACRWRPPSAPTSAPMRWMRCRRPARRPAATVCQSLVQNPGFGVFRVFLPRHH